MAINFGTAARNAASDIVKRRRGNPDPDGVIASRVADQIVQSSSRDIGAFLQSAPAPNPAPRAREMASENARFMRDFMGGGGNSSETNRPRPPVGPAGRSGVGIGSAAMGGVDPYEIEYLKDQMGISEGGAFNMPLPRMRGINAGMEANPDILAALLPAVGGPGEGPRPVYGGEGARMRGPVQFDNKTFPVYEDGSFSMGTPAPLWPAPAPYPVGSGAASPFGTMPAPPTLLPGMQERMDPETIAVLRYLGLI